MDAVERLLEREYGPLLFYPAYIQVDPRIGYLTRYAPGARENGGVYTHAATWAVLAECLLGRGDVAYRMYRKMCPIYRGLNPDLYQAEPYRQRGRAGFGLFRPRELDLVHRLGWLDVEGGGRGHPGRASSLRGVAG